MPTPSMLGNLFKLFLFITMWNPLALVQHSQFLTCCLAPGLCLIHKPSQKDTLTNMSAYSLRSPQLQDLQSKDHALQLPVLQAQVSGDKSQFQNPGLPSVWEVVSTAYWTSPFRCLTETSNSDVENEFPFHLYAKTLSSPIISYAWSPSHIQSATNPCQFPQKIVPHISPQFSLPSTIQIVIMLQKVKNLTPPMMYSCTQINRSLIYNLSYCVYCVLSCYQFLSFTKIGPY